MLKDKSFPWEQITALSMRSICRDLGLKNLGRRSDMISFLQSVSNVGLPKALRTAPATSSTIIRPSQKRARDTTTTTTTTSTTTTSRTDGDNSTPTKRPRISTVNDYNTRFRSSRRGRLSDPGPGRGRRVVTGTLVSASIATSAARRRRRRSVAAVSPSSATPEGDSPSISTRVTRGRGLVVKEEPERKTARVTSRRRTQSAGGARAARGRFRKEEEPEESVSARARSKRKAKPQSVSASPRKRVKSGPSISVGRRTASRGGTSQAKSVTSPQRRPSARRGRGHPRKVRSNEIALSKAKLVFDGVELPPLSKAFSSALKRAEDPVALGDEDADGEVDGDPEPDGKLGGKDEVHRETRGVVDAGSDGVKSVEQNRQRMERVENNGAEGDEGHEEEEEGRADDEMVIDQRDEGMADEDEDELGGPIPEDDASSLGNSNKENEAPDGGSINQDFNQDFNQDMVDFDTEDMDDTALDAELAGDQGLHDLSAAAAAVALFGTSAAASFTATTTTDTATSITVLSAREAVVSEMLMTGEQSEAVEEESNPFV
ncbi:hypothetical protein AX17_007268 [Amanita inopinata Kibby_2008]|nr:hypothetical protein AX17_007268 [Amanita inopinata Kibby_2008]